MTATKATITNPEEFLKLSEEQLDNIFRNAPAGEIPIGQGDGTAVIAPGTVVSDTIAKFVHIFTWKGKAFEPDPIDPQRALLKIACFCWVRKRSWPRFIEARAGLMKKSASSWITPRPQ
jgi:hypothetical protein